MKEENVQAVSESEYYQLAVSGAPLVASDVEEATNVVEVLVAWGDARNVLQVTHVAEQDAFVLGDGGDFLMDPSLLGAEIATLVRGNVLEVPATASIESDVELAPGGTMVVGEGTEVTLLLGDFRLLVRGVRAGKKVAPRTSGIERQPLFFVGGTMLLTGLLLGIMSLTPPHGMAMTGDQLNPNSRLVEYFIESEALEEPEEIAFDPGPNGGDEGGAERGDEGEMGDEAAPETQNAYAIQGDARPEERQLSRQTQRDNAAVAGIIGVLQSSVSLAPTSVYGADTAIGSDPMNALGALYGIDIGDNHGFGGLGLRGTGRHGGGDGLGHVGLGEGGIGHGLGCDGDGPCLGGGRGPSGDAMGLRAHRSQGPRLGIGTAIVNGALSREVIRRTIQRHRNEVKFCYERGLQQNPSLEGRVTTRFVISPTGAVAAASVAGSTLRHNETEQCVAQVVRRITFPQPDNAGPVSVTYPFSFASH